jgi:hypothetical protein
MKKSIAFIGAMFMSAITFAQVNKNDNTNKTPSRKVIDADVKDLAPDPETNASTGEIKGEYHQKIKGEQRAAIHKGGTYKGSSIQKSSDASAGKETTEVEAFDAKHPRDYKKPSDNKSTSIQKEDFTIKSNGSETQAEKTSSDPYLKVTSEKNSTTLEKTTIKDSGTQNQNASSGNFMKIGDVKGEKEK